MSLRDDVAKALFRQAWPTGRDLWKPGSSAYNGMADAAISAMPKLSPEALKTIRDALDFYSGNNDTFYDHRIAAARAELEALP